MSYNPSLDLTANILLVDDLPENLQLLSDLLLTLGYSVRSVTSGRMALKTSKVKRPDIVLLDIKMPDMDGYQVCQAFKADEELRDIPIVFISALDDVFDKVKAFWSGGVDYITKPFHSEEVVVRLENQLTIQRQKRSLQDEVARRKETEEMLYQSRALVTSVLNSVSDGIAAVQSVREPTTGEISDFRCLVVNPVIAKIFSRNREDLIGQLVLKRFLKRIQPDLFEKFINVVEEGEDLEEEIHHTSGQEVWYQVNAVKLGDGLTITLRDITHKKNISPQINC
ncbi:MAG: response regulator [Pseudanabaena sp.]|nr:MAG: response regulator [Pseudanabaena sp.]